MNSSNGRGILKCSLAYLLASMVTFVPALRGLIGTHLDSKHMVATVTVWFHPARTIGSMHQATLLALLGFVYSAIVCFSSMAISMFFGANGLLGVGHAIVLVVFVGGGLGFVAWVKQHFSSPLVNVACSLASLGCITVLLKEGSVQAGTFSERRVLQVLLMVAEGILITTFVNLILPVTARHQLRKGIAKNTDLLGEVLISITRAFLAGREQYIQDEYFTDLQREHQQSLVKMTNDLDEAKKELYVLGREKQYVAAAKVVECLDGLAQDIGGLRSAALAQFALVNSTAVGSSDDESSSWGATAPAKIIRQNTLDIVDENIDESMAINVSDSAALEGRSPTIRENEENSSQPTAIVNADESHLLASPSQMFATFMKQLGPPSKSLVFTLKKILDDLPFSGPQKRDGCSGVF